jgi:hypothetical protein
MIENTFIDGALFAALMASLPGLIYACTTLISASVFVVVITYLLKIAFSKR